MTQDQILALFYWLFFLFRVEKPMSEAFDIRQFPGLPPEVVKAFEAQQFELAVERAARQHERFCRKFF